MLICIDAGHGGTDPGALGPNGRREKDDTLLYALELDRLFQLQGIDTLMIRENDLSVDLNSRPAIANKARADLYISCHRNAAGSPASGGAEIWLHTDATPNMQRWAGQMLEGFAAVGFTARSSNSRGWPAGVKRGHNDGVHANFAVNRLTTMPSMLVELGFITSPEDNERFDAHYKECCTAIVKSTCAYMGRAYHTPLEMPEETVPKVEYDALHARYEALVGEIKALTEKYTA